MLMTNDSLIAALAPCAAKLTRDEYSALVRAIESAAMSTDGVMVARDFVDEWPEVTEKVTATGVQWPRDESVSLDIQVKPCGEDAWVPHLVVWGPEVERVTMPSYRPLHVELEYCVDVSHLTAAIPVSHLDSPEHLVATVAEGIAAVLAMSAKVEIELTMNSSVEFKLTCDTYEARGWSPLKTFLEHVEGRTLANVV